jgi:DNA-binding NarL/FixJ family response regulator
LLEDAARGVDARSLGDEAAALRQRAARLGRDERALGGGASAGDGATAAAMKAVIVVWVVDAARAASLRGCLATAGFPCVLGSGDDASAVIAGASASASAAASANAEGSARVAIVVSARDGVERVRGLRAVAKGVPVVVVDVRAPDGTTEAIRAGASDMLLEGAPDADIVAKLTRLLRKKARS